MHVVAVVVVVLLIGSCGAMAGHGMEMTVSLLLAFG